MGSEVSLVSTGNQIFLNVPQDAFQGNIRIVVRQGNQFSVTDITIYGAVTNMLLNLGVGVGNQVSQVMIGEYFIIEDEDANPIEVLPEDIKCLFILD